MKRTLNMIVGDIVAKNKGKKFSCHELAEMVVKTEPEFVKRKIEKTGKEDKVLVFQLMSEIGAQFPMMKPFFVVKTTTKPTRYFYKKTADGEKARERWTLRMKAQEARYKAKEEAKARAAARRAAREKAAAEAAKALKAKAKAKAAKAAAKGKKKTAKK